MGSIETRLSEDWEQRREGKLQLDVKKNVGKK